MTSASQLYQEGQLEEAISAIQNEIKKDPANTSKRAFLTELLCFAGELERADKQLDIITSQEPEAAAGLAFWRQMIRAEQDRQDFFTSGKAPHFIGEPTPMITSLIKASIAIRDGEYPEAIAQIEAAEESKIALEIKCNGEIAEDFRDLDDLTSGVLEVMANNGKYYWIDFSQINSIEFLPPSRPIDLLWRKASIDVKEGPDGEVFIPTIYSSNNGSDSSNNGNASDALAKLGRKTEWTQDEDKPLRGIGMRAFLVGEEMKTIMDIDTLEIRKQ